MDISSYHGAYFKKKDHHIYIKPAPIFQTMIAHYTITYASDEPVECEKYHIARATSTRKYVLGSHE